MEKQIEVYFDFRKKIIAYNYIDWLISWDQETQAPPKSAKFRSEQVEVLSKIFRENGYAKDIRLIISCFM